MEKLKRSYLIKKHTKTIKIWYVYIKYVDNNTQIV